MVYMPFRVHESPLPSFTAAHRTGAHRALDNDCDGIPLFIFTGNIATRRLGTIELPEPKPPCTPASSHLPAYPADQPATTNVSRFKKPVVTVLDRFCSTALATSLPCLPCLPLELALCAGKGFRLSLGPPVAFWPAARAFTAAVCGDAVNRLPITAPSIRPTSLLGL